jgi:hypothetical protein
MSALLSDCGSFAIYLGEKCRFLAKNSSKLSFNDYLIENGVCLRECFSVLPNAPHGQNPKLGTLHPSMIRVTSIALKAASK